MVYSLIGAICRLEVKLGSTRSHLLSRAKFFKGAARTTQGVNAQRETMLIIPRALSLREVAVQVDTSYQFFVLGSSGNGNENVA